MNAWYDYCYLILLQLWKNMKKKKSKSICFTLLKVNSLHHTHHTLTTQTTIKWSQYFPKHESNSDISDVYLKQNISFYSNICTVV